MDSEFLGAPGRWGQEAGTKEDPFRGLTVGREGLRKCLQGTSTQHARGDPALSLPGQVWRAANGQGGA